VKPARYWIKMLEFYCCRRCPLITSNYLFGRLQAVKMHGSTLRMAQERRRIWTLAILAANVLQLKSGADHQPAHGRFGHIRSKPLCSLAFLSHIYEKVYSV
jgi:hypothetical protein